MKFKYKRIVVILCILSILLSMTYIPANAENPSSKYYGLTCPKSEDSRYSLHECNCAAALNITDSSDRDYYSTVIQDSRYISDEVIVEDFQKKLDETCKIWNEEYAKNDGKIIEDKMSVYFRIFKGSVLDCFYGDHDPTKSYYATPLNVHTMLQKCYQIVYDALCWSRFKDYNEDGTYEIKEVEFTAGAMRGQMQPITQSWNTWFSNDAFDYFMENPKEALTSAEITKQFADDIDIEYIFCFQDSGAAVIYCVTNHGDYIYYSPENRADNQLSFVFTVEGFEYMLKEVANRISIYRHLSYDTCWNILTDNDPSFKHIIGAYEKDEIMPHIVGGESANTSYNIKDSDYGKYLTASNISTQTPPDSTEQKPTDAVGKPIEPPTDEKREQIFTVLFFAETAVIIVTVATGSIFFVRARKRKQQR